MQPSKYKTVCYLCFFLQAWLYVNRDEQILVLAFPGTDTNEDQDVDTSADTRRVKLKTAWKRLSNSDLEAGNLGPSLKVHEGYKKAYLSVRNTLLDIVDSVTEWSTQWTIIVTGHSLGGSLATIAAYDLATITYVILLLLLRSLLLV